MKFFQIPKNFLAFVVGFAFIACNSNSIDVFYSHQLVAEDENIQFPLDSVTSPLVNSIIYSEENDGKLVYFNQQQQVIYVHDFTSNRLLSQIRPNTHFYIDGIYYHSNDTILLMSKFDGMIQMIDSEGVIKREFDVNPYIAGRFSGKGKENVSIPMMIGLNNQPVFTKNFLFLTGHKNDGHKQHTNTLTMDRASTMIKYDLFNMGIDYALSYPNPYVKNVHYRHVYRAFDGERFIYSFPADHHLYISKIDELHRTEKKAAASRYFDRVFPFSNIDKLQDGVGYFSHQAYLYIIYNPYTKNYYRIARHPIGNFDVKRPPNNIKVSIIILNEHMEIIGESMLAEDTYDIGRFFVSPKGLHFMNKNNKNEDILEFYTFIEKGI